ncbi:MAG: prepilin-type N-terminal cleavage/methylation domain-containing protein [Thermodesulfobacteriota bacterium]|nr:prepilin-type N-terminal cleavage/methylation domain-containing protein [Thermodesulfobacteriota bacterium]
MRQTKGFTILELIVVIAVVALLATVALPKFYHLTMRAEALGAQGMIGNVRSALSLQMARGLYQGQDLAAWAHNGSRALYPMHDMLLEQPENYLGVLENSDQRGSWYDDKNSHELVYVVRNDEVVSGITGTPKKARWRINVIYDDRHPQHVETLQAMSVLGLVLKPATAHQWKFE